MPKPGTASHHASQAPSALLDLIGAPQSNAAPKCRNSRELEVAIGRTYGVE